MSKIVLFDLDDTILDFHKCEKAALTQTLKALDVPVTEQNITLYSKINDSMWKKLERGELTRQQVLTNRFEEFFNQIGICRDSLKTKTLYEQSLSRQCYFVEGALPLLKHLYKKYDLYIISNGTAHVQDGRIAAAKIAKYFKDIFISDKIGKNKPSKEFFIYCAEHITNFDPKDAIIVGDSPSSDILGGINAGITTCRYNPQNAENPSGIIPDYQISRLSDLPKILERHFKNGGEK